MMTVAECLSTLRAHAELPLAIVLPDGGLIPRHFHITEVGHVVKNFIDCGGTRRRDESCLLQTWVHDDVDHRLHAGKLAGIFDKSGDVLPDHQVPVQIEYEDTFVAQFPLESAAVLEGVLTFQCGWKHTDCLARNICLPGECCSVPAAEVKPAAETDCCAGSKCCP